MSQQRFEYLDIAKGIGIILVVLHHTSGNGSLPFLFIASFHMPLFFIISGLCFNESRYSSFSDYLKRKIQVLLLPLFAFTALVFIGSLLTGSDFYSLELLMALHLPIAYWFVAVLFVTELFFYIVCRIVKQQKYRTIVLALSLSAAWLLQYYDIHLGFNMSSVFIALFFYGFAYMIKGSVINILKHRILIAGGLALLIPVLIYHENLDLSVNSVPSPYLLFVAVAVIASIATLVFSHNFVKQTTIKKVLLWLGQNTFVILLLHMFALNLSVMFIKPMINTHLLYKIIEQTFIWLFCLTGVYVVNNHAPWMIGKTRKQ